jgi:hypothetical protein
MSKENQNAAFTTKEWVAIASIGTAGAALGGPLGAAGAMAGAAGGTYVAKKLGWMDESDSDS